VAEARRLGEQALDLKLRIGLRTELSRSYNFLGLVAWDEERLADASALFERATEAARAVGDSAGIAKAAINAGLVLDGLGSFAAARRALSTGRDVARAVGDSVNLGRALTDLARIDIALGDPVAAVSGIETGRRLFQATGDSIGEVNAIAQLATAFAALGDAQAAFAALDTAQRMARRLGLRREEAEDLTLIGDLFSDAGDQRHALDYYSRARALTDSLGITEVLGDVLRSEARAHAQLGNHALAMQRGLEALRVHGAGELRDAQLTDRLFLAELTQLMGQPREAESQLRAAKALAAWLGTDVAVGRVALTEARVATSADAPHRVLRVLHAARGPLRMLGSGETADAMALRARAYARLGRLDAAVSAGAQAIAAVERIRGNYRSDQLRTSYASGKAALYADQVLLLLRLNRVADAFTVADAARGRALLERLATARADIRGGDAVHLVLERDELLHRIDALVGKLRERASGPARERTPSVLAVTRGLSDSLVAARNEYEALLARSSGQSGSLAMSFLGASVTVQQVQSSLAPSEALLEYLITPTRLLIFVVTRSGFTVRDGPEGEMSLGPRMRLARALVQRPRGGEGSAAVLEALHKAVLAPVESSGALQGVTRLVIVPHDALTYLPFAALVDGTDNRYVVQKYALLQASTAGAFVAMRQATVRDGQRRSPGPSGVVFAPFPNELRATRDESEVFLRSISPSVAHVGVAATEMRLRSALASGSLVHLATHAVMNPRNPLFSRIELAGDHDGASDDDGRLEVHELLGLRAASPLVFLSGCETALGAAGSTTFDTGEDFTTIGQGLLLAGARNVIATLWRIDDAAAARFTERFYGSLKTRPVADALADAQRSMIADAGLKDPYWWAAYQLSGGGLESVFVANPRVVSDKR
jgi:CHAT domain-containing protein/tetratricopeptide (TPR) repeat protein